MLIICVFGCQSLLLTVHRTLPYPYSFFSRFSTTVKAVNEDACSDEQGLSFYLLIHHGLADVFYGWQEVRVHMSFYGH